MERMDLEEDMVITTHGRKWMTSGQDVEDTLGKHPEQICRRTSISRLNPPRHSCPHYFVPPSLDIVDVDSSPSFPLRCCLTENPAGYSFFPGASSPISFSSHQSEPVSLPLCQKTRHVHSLQPNPPQLPTSPTPTPKSTCCSATPEPSRLSCSSPVPLSLPQRSAPPPRTMSASLMRPSPPPFTSPARARALPRQWPRQLVLLPSAPRALPGTIPSRWSPRSSTPRISTPSSAALPPSPTAQPAHRFSPLRSPLSRPPTSFRPAASLPCLVERSLLEFPLEFPLDFLCLPSHLDRFLQGDPGPLA